MQEIVLANTHAACVIIVQKVASALVPELLTSPSAFSLHVPAVIKKSFRPVVWKLPIEVDLRISATVIYVNEIDR